MLKEAVPGISTVAYLHDANYGPLASTYFDPAKRIGVRVAILGVKAAKDIDGALATAPPGRTRGVVVENSPLFYDHFARIAQLSIRSRLVTIAHSPEFAEAGGFLSYGAAPWSAIRDVVPVLDKILKGVNPADIPVWQPTKFTLVINRKTAKALGLTIPPSLLQRADEVIQ